MFNIIKMDLYRLVHSISFWVMILVVIAMAFFTIGASKSDLAIIVEDNKGEKVEQVVDAEVEEHAEVGVYMMAKPEWLEKASLADLVNENIKGKILLIVCAIFIPIFVNAEYKNGYIKNIAGQLPNRGVLILSKLVAVAVQILVMFVTYLLFSGIAGYIFFEEAFCIGGLSELLRVISLQYLLNLAFGTAVLLVSVVTKSSAFATTFGILCGASVNTILFAGINKLIYLFGVSEKFNIGYYVPEVNVGFVSFDMSNDIMMRVLVVSFAYIIVATIVSMFVMQKRDV